jgi:serine phosphatase RsbU (regulator of sigma subunit)/uncharacterized CHY-type Zn-finger protein
MPDLQRELYQHELGIAADIQACMLPKKLPKIPGIDLSAFYQPCQYVGGDYYDLIEMDAQHLGIVVADVSGKGVPGALVMAQARTLVRAESEHSSSPREILSRVNKHLAGEIPRGMFVTMYFALLDVARSVVTFCSAGHNPALYFRRSAGKVASVTTKGLVIGIYQGKQFEQTLSELKVQFEPGDRFLLYTDGLSEAMNSRREEFGTRRLAACVQSLGNQRCAEFLFGLSQEVEKFTAGAPQHDDITAVAVRRLDEPMPSSPDARTIVDGERFVQCGFCEAVNPREVSKCQVCHEPLQRLGRAQIQLKKHEVECSGCRRIFSRKSYERCCPYCKRPLCGMCRRQTASVGAFCSRCARKRP